MSWDADKASTALVDLFSAALPHVKVFGEPPQTLNPPAVVISDADVTYNNATFCADTATVPVVVIGGIDTKTALETMKNTLRSALDGDENLGGVVHYASATGERNWRSGTSAGGIQLLSVELIVEVQM